MTENVDFVRVWKRQNRKYLENGAPYEEKYEFVLLVERNPMVFVSGRYDQ